MCKNDEVPFVSFIPFPSVSLCASFRSLSVAWRFVAALRGAAVWAGRWPWATLFGSSLLTLLLLTMPSFQSLTTDAGLVELNSYLETRSYIDGSANAADAANKLRTQHPTAGLEERDTTANDTRQDATGHAGRMARTAVLQTGTFAPPRWCQPGISRVPLVPSHGRPRAHSLDDRRQST